MSINFRDKFSFLFRSGAGIDRAQVYLQEEVDDGLDSRLAAVERKTVSLTYEEGGTWANVANVAAGALYLVPEGTSVNTAAERQAVARAVAEADWSTSLDNAYGYVIVRVPHDASAGRYRLFDSPLTSEFHDIYLLLSTFNAAGDSADSNPTYDYYISNGVLGGSRNLALQSQGADGSTGFTGKIVELADIEQGGAANAQILSWNNASGTWEPVNAPSGGGTTYTGGTGITISGSTITVTNPFTNADEAKLDGLPAITSIGTGLTLTGGALTANDQNGITQSEGDARYLQLTGSSADLGDADDFRARLRGEIVADNNARTVTASDYNKILHFWGSNSNIAWTLPNLDNSQGGTRFFVNNGADNDLTINPHSTDQINRGGAGNGVTLSPGEFGIIWAANPAPAGNWFMRKLVDLSDDGGAAGLLDGTAIALASGATTLTAAAHNKKLLAYAHNDATGIARLWTSATAGDSVALHNNSNTEPLIVGVPSGTGSWRLPPGGRLLVVATGASVWREISLDTPLVNYASAADADNYEVGEVVQADNGLFKVTSNTEQTILFTPGRHEAGGTDNEARGIALQGSNWNGHPVLGELEHAPIDANGNPPILSCYILFQNGNAYFRVELRQDRYNDGAASDWTAAAQTPLYVTFSGTHSGSTVTDHQLITDSLATPFTYNGSTYIAFEHAIVGYDASVNTSIADFANITNGGAQVSIALYASTTAAAARRIGGFAVRGLTRLHDPAIDGVSRDVTALRDSLPDFSHMQQQINNNSDLLGDMSHGEAETTWTESTNALTAGGFDVSANEWTLAAARIVQNNQWLTTMTYSDTRGYLVARIPHGLDPSLAELEFLHVNGSRSYLKLNQMTNLGNTAAVDYKFFTAYRQELVTEDITRVTLRLASARERTTYNGQFGADAVRVLTQTQYNAISDKSPVFYLISG